MRKGIEDDFGAGPAVNWRGEASTIGASVPIATPSSVSRHGQTGTLYTNAGKRIFDIAVVLATLPLILPLIILCAFALWIEGGNPFYWQARLGRGGKVFRLLKLRTMTRNAQAELEQILANDPLLREEWNTTQKLKNDPRITPIGQFLRSTSLDELPQIWNILRGEMSTVGPRPMMPDQLELYGEAQAYFALRPGLSGLWQIRERNDSHFSYRANVDKAYQSAQSLWLDLFILWQTIFVVLRRTGH